jgi:hypothetical protein
MASFLCIGFAQGVIQGSFLSVWKAECNQRCHLIGRIWRKTINYMSLRHRAQPGQLTFGELASGCHRLVDEDLPTRRRGLCVIRALIDALLKIIEIKQNCLKANIAKIDVGPKGALVSFFEDRFPNPAGLVAYVQRLDGVARLRPDSKVVVTRAWPDPAARLNGALQLSKGLAKAAG